MLYMYPLAYVTIFDISFGKILDHHATGWAMTENTVSQVSHTVTTTS